MPDISVIIPTYNGEQYIGDAIESVLAQQGVSLEIIVVDDGSSDGTLKRVRGFGDKVRWIRKENGGVASARNLGVANASGRYVALLDQDDRFLPGKLATQLDLMLKNPEAILCHANIRMIGESGEPVASGHLGHSPETHPPSGCVEKELFQANFIFACTVLMKRDSVLQVSGFNEKLWGVDDYELWLKLSMQGRILYLNKIVSEYRWHADNASRDEARMSLGRILAREEFLLECPEAWNKIGVDFIRTIISKRAAEFAYPLYKSGNAKCARTILMKGLKFAPFNRMLWKMYISSWFH